MDENDKKDLSDLINTGAGPAALKFAINAIGGAIPFAGGAIGAATTAWSDQEQKKINALLQT